MKNYLCINYTGFILANRASNEWPSAHTLQKSCGVPLKERLCWGGTRPPTVLSVLNTFDHSQIEEIFDMCSFCSAGGYHIPSRRNPIKPAQMQMHAHTLTLFPSPLVAFCAWNTILSSSFMEMYVNDLHSIDNVNDKNQDTMMLRSFKSAVFGRILLVHLFLIHPRLIKIRTSAYMFEKCEMRCSGFVSLHFSDGKSTRACCLQLYKY